MMSNSFSYLSPETSSTQSRPSHAQVVQMMSGGVYGFVIAQAIYALAALGIADHLKDGPRTSDELARVTHAHSPSLYRLLRTMAGLGLFTEDAEHGFSLTPLGATLQTGVPGFARSTVLSMGGQLLSQAWTEFLHSIETGGTAFEKAHGAPFFERLTKLPEESSYFNEMMIAVHGDEPPAVAAAYDFSEIGKLVDVGGGTGNLLTTILLANPKMNGVLYDLPHVAQEARREIEMKGLADRCEVVEGNFFESVPEGGDAYILSHIIHDWEESKCLTILENCRRVMSGRGRLLLVEIVIPPSSDFHPGKLLDLAMLAVTGGGERSENQYAALLARGGLKLTRVVPTESSVSVIEAEPI
jgi:hypothetical protein